MKKIIGAILAFAGIFLLFTLTAFAAEGEKDTYTPLSSATPVSESDPCSQTETASTEPGGQSAEDETADASSGDGAENGTPADESSDIGVKNNAPADALPDIGAENNATADELPDIGAENNAPADASAGAETEKGAAEASAGNGAENAQPGETVFSSLYRLLCEHAGEIFSTLAFLASMLVAFAYKRGLIPLLNSGISALTGAATRIGEAADGSLKSADGLYEKMAERLSGAEEQLRVGTAALESFSERLRALEKSPDSTAALGQVLAEQVQMLAEIFQSTSLPQFRKDEIAQRALAMKEVAAAFAQAAARGSEASV